MQKKRKCIFLNDCFIFLSWCYTSVCFSSRFKFSLVLEYRSIPFYILPSIAHSFKRLWFDCVALCSVINNQKNQKGGKRRRRGLSYLNLSRLVYFVYFTDGFHRINVDALGGPSSSRRRANVTSVGWNRKIGEREKKIKDENVGNRQQLLIYYVDCFFSGKKGDVRKLILK